MQPRPEPRPRPTTINKKRSPPELPFILHPFLKRKIFLDTGSTNSYINPKLANKFFQKNIIFDPIKITSAHGSSNQNFAIKRPFFEILHSNIPLTFHMYDFHSEFDILLGLDNLRKLKVKFDFIEDVLTTKKRNFKIHYFNTKSKECSINNLNIDFSKFRLDHLNNEKKFGLTKLIKKFPNIVYSENMPLTFTNQIKHTIRTINDTPVQYTKQFRLPEVHRSELERQVNSLLEQNIIEPSHSPFAWLVTKKLDASGKPKWRLVTDFRKLNEKTIDDKYPIPNITDILDKLGKYNYFNRQ